MTRCNHCGGSVTRSRRRGPGAINNDETTEFRFECRRCERVVDVLLMDGVGWEPCFMVDLDDADAPGVEA